MRLRNMLKRNAGTLAAVGLAGMLALPAGAGELYRWTTSDGTVAYTDDADRIPARYRGQAKREGRKGLDDYARYTPRVAGTMENRRERLMDRLEHLRALNEASGPATSGMAAAAPSATTSIEIDDRTTVHVPSGGAGDEPIVVEEVRVKPDGSLFTHHNTVVRQGDRILMVVRPDQPHQAGPNDFIDEDELLGR